MILYHFAYAFSFANKYFPHVHNTPITFGDGLSNGRLHQAARRQQASRQAQQLLLRLRLGGAILLLGDFAEGLRARKKRDDLRLHFGKVFKPETRIENDEGVALLAVFVDAADLAVLKLLRIALDENFRALEHNGEDIDDVLHRGVVERDELPEELARVLLLERLLLLFLHRREVYAVPLRKRLPVALGGLPALRVAVETLIPLGSFFKRAHNRRTVDERFLAETAYMAARPDVPFL